MIIINIKVDADDTDKKPQTFKADVEVYQDGEKLNNTPVSNKDFRKLIDAAYKIARGKSSHYRMLSYKTKTQVDWEQYTFVYKDGEGFQSDNGLSFKSFLGMFDESHISKSTEFLDLIKEDVSWKEHSKISAYTVWYYEKGDKKVYQVTKGGKPSGEGGYYNLESLLKLKGLQ